MNPKCFILSIIALVSTLPHHTTQAIQNNDIQSVILAAGEGSRFKTGISKLIYPIGGQAMVVYPIKLMQNLNISTSLIVGFQQNKVKKAVKDAGIIETNFMEQKEQLGTGHALLCSKPVWHAKNILVLNGDGPMLTKKVIEDLCKTHIDSNAAISFIVSHFVGEGRYGRIVDTNNIVKIVEAKHFAYKKTDYPHINAGIYLINRAFLEEYLTKVKQNEVTNEFYLTDLVEIASKNNLPVKMVVAPYDTIRGVNTLKELYDAQHIKQTEKIEKLMANGVQFNNPLTVHLDINVTIAPRTYIDTGVQLRGNTTIGKECRIGAYAILENANIKDGTIIEDFAVIKQ